MRELGWRPQFSDLHAIVRSAWEWKREHPRGYQDGDVNLRFRPVEQNSTIEASSLTPICPDR